MSREMIEDHLQSELSQLSVQELAEGLYQLDVPLPGVHRHVTINLEQVEEGELRLSDARTARPRVNADTLRLMHLAGLPEHVQLIDGCLIANVSNSVWDISNKLWDLVQAIESATLVEDVVAHALYEHGVDLQGPAMELIDQ